MFENYNLYKVLRVFLDDPTRKEDFKLREISRKIGLSTKSVKIYLDILRKKDLIIKDASQSSGAPVYRSNFDSRKFRMYKKLDSIMRIEESGLPDFLDSVLSPKCIILFGSAAKGEDVKESDIDIFVESREKKISLKEFEAKLGKEIQITFAERVDYLGNIKDNVINGMKLRGRLDILPPTGA